MFWSLDIPKGAPDYHEVIRRNLREAVVVVVAWTRASVKSHPVTQECAQAERESKLLQVVLDRLEPIDFPMEVRFRSEKTMLIDWSGDSSHPDWIALNRAIEGRLSQRALMPGVPAVAHSDPLSAAAPDDLMRIRGVTVRIASTLHELGVTRYDHIASWTSADIDRVGETLKVRGKIEHDNWIEQARLLASGETTEYARRYDIGEP